MFSPFFNRKKTQNESAKTNKENKQDQKVQNILQAANPSHYGHFASNRPLTQQTNNSTKPSEEEIRQLARDACNSFG